MNSPTPEIPNHDLVRNLVRLFASAFLEEVDSPASEAFVHLFAVWSPPGASDQDAGQDKPPFTKVCDYLWTYYSAGADRQPVTVADLKRVYRGESLGGEAEDARIGYKAAQPPAEEVGRINERLKSLGIVGDADRLANITQLLYQAIHFGFPILIEGELGVGKRYLAQALHQIDGADHLDSIALSGANLTSDQLAAAMVRYGTVMIEDPFTIPRWEQPAVSDLISCYPTHSTARLIALSTVGMEAMVEAGNFGRKLFYQLSVIRVRLAPLRERLTEVPTLAKLFIDRFRSINASLPATDLAPEAVDKLTKHAWPGNLDELEGVIARAMIRCHSPIIVSEHIVFTSSSPRKEYA